MHRSSILLTTCLACATPGPPATSSTTRDSKPAEPRPSTPTEVTPPKGTTGDPFAEGFVAAHNHQRASVSPTAKPALPPVRWNEDLAAQARGWAQRCDFRHSKTDHGENLSARTDQAEPATIVAAWAAEAADYDHRQNRCASGKVCGHYTQVVWRDSTAIGCGVARCSGGGPFGGGEWFMWVCNYDPPGNWKGQRPY